MSVLNRIAFFPNRRDEKPNQELARELAQSGDEDGVQEIAENLWNQNPNIRSDCLKVLYELGYLKPDLKPELIARYAGDFLKLLGSENNRLVWGGMIALSTVGRLRAAELFPHRQVIQRTMERGSVITVDAGVRTLAAIASQAEAFSRELFPYLLARLQACRPKDVPQQAEQILIAVNAGNSQEFIQVIEERMAEMSHSQAARLKRVLKEAAKRQ